MFASLHGTKSPFFFGLRAETNRASSPEGDRMTLVICLAPNFGLVLLTLRPTDFPLLIPFAPMPWSGNGWRMSSPQRRWNDINLILEGVQRRWCRHVEEWNESQSLRVLACLNCCCRSLLPSLIIVGCSSCCFTARLSCTVDFQSRNQMIRKVTWFGGKCIYKTASKFQHMRQTVGNFIVFYIEPFQIEWITTFKEKKNHHKAREVLFGSNLISCKCVRVSRCCAPAK